MTGVTARIGNIPCRLTEADITAALHSFSLAGSFRSVYVPCRRNQKGNLGYCFVEFVDLDAFEDCIRKVHDRAFGDVASLKRCMVTMAKQQAPTRRRGLQRPDVDADSMMLGELYCL